MQKVIPFWAGVVAVIAHMSLRYSLRFLWEELDNFSLVIFCLRFHWSFVIFIIFKIIYSEILFTFRFLSLLSCCSCCRHCCRFIFSFILFLFGFRLLNYQNVTNFSRIRIGWNNRDSLICIARVNNNLVVFTIDLSLRFVHRFILDNCINKIYGCIFGIS